MVKKSTYKIKNIGGLSLATRDSVGYIRNMIREGDSLVKRQGWRVLHSFKNDLFKPLKINGIFDYGSSLVVHAGTELYLTSYDFTEERKIPLENGVAVTDERSLGYKYGELLFLCMGGKLLVYDGFTVKDLYEWKDAYVPTTSINIKDFVTYTSGTPGESPNLLTAKRKNTLRGKWRDEKFHVFKLDAPAAMGKPFTLTVRIKVQKSEDDETDETYSGYIGVYPDGNTVDGILTARFHTDNLSREAVPQVSLKNLFGEDMTLKDEADLLCYVLGDMILLHFNCATPNLDEDNMIAEFYADAPSPLSEGYTRLFSLCVSETGKSQLLLAQEGNKLIYTHSSGDLFYFPEKNQLTIGSDREEITAILPMSDSFTCVYKERSIYRVKATEEGATVYSSEDTEGCVSPFGAARINGDCLSLSHGGVFGIKELIENEKIITRLTDRSLPISSILSSHRRDELEGALLRVHKGLVYLFIGKNAYVARDTGGGYEWFVFDSCPAYSLCATEDTLYMGRENGDIAVFDKSYYDKEITALHQSQGDYLFKAYDNHTGVTFNEDLGIKEGDRVFLSNHFAFCRDCTYDKDTGEISIVKGVFFDENMCVAFYEGMKIRLYDKEDKLLFEGEITDTFPHKCTIKCDLELEESATLYMYVLRTERDKYTLEKSSTYFYLFYNGLPAKIALPYDNPIFVEREQAVEAEICTPAIDFGTDAKKHLFGIELLPTNNTFGRVRVGYQTIANAYEKELVIGSELDLDSLSFSTFSFNPLFKRRIRVPCLERCFDYIKIKVAACDPLPFGIEGISLIYSHGRE